MNSTNAINLCKSLYSDFKTGKYKSRVTDFFGKMRLIAHLPSTKMAGVDKELVKELIEIRKTIKTALKMSEEASTKPSEELQWLGKLFLKNGTSVAGSKVDSQARQLAFQHFGFPEESSKVPVVGATEMAPPQPVGKVHRQVTKAPTTTTTTVTASSETGEISATGKNVAKLTPHKQGIYSLANGDAFLLYDVLLKGHVLALKVPHKMPDGSISVGYIKLRNLNVLLDKSQIKDLSSWISVGNPGQFR